MANTIYKTAEREKTEILTSVGPLVPSYTFEDDGRKKEPIIKYYSDGSLKYLPLEDATNIKTSVGSFSAELVTFYKSGALKRLFQLNGRITGYWTESDEYSMAENISILTKSGLIDVKPIYLQFYETGELQSILFWPNERVELNTPVGEIKIRKGVSFYKDGSLASCEPAVETLVKTSIGTIAVYDPDPEGIMAESETLQFTPDGEISMVSTKKNRVMIKNKDSVENIYSPKAIESYCNEKVSLIVPLKINFKPEKIIFKRQFSVLGEIDRGAEISIEEFIC
ncbi:MAG: hypothetical protein PQJ46_04220 [Spirochaetales bacterium]|nr:hypothetical protein [Spirochaetales bacterium]